MRIAQVAPLHESVPPKLYGGTERIVHYLTEELVNRGHAVTLFASGDSNTRAHLEPIVPRALRLDHTVTEPLAPHMVMFDKVNRMAKEFDVIHFHTDYLHFPIFRACPTPHLNTLHGRQDLQDLKLVYQHFRDVPLVSISDFQRQPIHWAHWLATVYHGLPEKLYTFRSEPGGYLVFLGRISPEKRPDRAIEIALRSGLPLKIAAKVDKGDLDYYRSTIVPLLNHPQVEFIGEVNEREKNELLGHALALLFPIDWPEPFGLVMIEALACGTPVIAYGHGSVPEVLRHGETGFIVGDIGQAVSAVEKLDGISRWQCRREFENRFSARRMTDDYLTLYRKLAENRAGVPESAIAGSKAKPRPLVAASAKTG
jgi:glycosyltransferase involved in cell wall biosynthesis